MKYFRIWMCLFECSNESLIVNKLLRYGFSVECLSQSNIPVLKTPKRSITATLALKIGIENVCDKGNKYTVPATCLNVAREIRDLLDNNNITFLNIVVTDFSVDCSWDNGNLAPIEKQEEDAALKEVEEILK